MSLFTASVADTTTDAAKNAGDAVAAVATPAKLPRLSQKAAVSATLATCPTNCVLNAQEAALAADWQ